MTTLSQFAYLQVRLQARYGQLPDSTVWRRLEGITALSHFLQTARTTGLRPWLLTIASGTRWDARSAPAGAAPAMAPITIAAHGNSHAMEKSLRRQLRQHIDEVTRWLPPPWRPAAVWCGLLPDLPALQHLLGSAGAPPWLLDDERLKPYTHDLRDMRLQALRNSPYAPLLNGSNDTSNLAAAWASHWQALWPATATGTDRAALERLAAQFADHYATLHNDRTQDSLRVRDHLDHHLRLGFRRHPHQAAAAFYYLALAGLSLERLRGLLTRLILFPQERTA
jgi:hypothetical protein